jgi:hypothetical protein
MGFVSLTSIVHVVGDAIFASGLGVKAEKKPCSRGWHGSSKLDWTTEWFWR